MKILHISDLHLPALLNPLTLRKKSLIGYANFYLRRRSKHLLNDHLISAIREIQYDICILSGDLTNVSHPKEFEEGKKFLKPILDERLFMIPGNHDRYTKKSIKEDLFENYFGDYMGEKILISHSMESFPFLNTTATTQSSFLEKDDRDKNNSSNSKLKNDKLHDFSKASLYLTKKQYGDLTFFGWDSNLLLPAMNAHGLLHPAVIQKTLDIIQESKIENYMIVCHHPIWNPIEIQESNHHKMRNRDEVVDMIRKKPPIAYYHGHLHTNWIKMPDPSIPFYVLNSASSTRDSDSGHESGFHLLEHTGVNLQKGWNIQRYSFNNDLKKFEKSPNILFK